MARGPGLAAFAVLRAIADGMRYGLDIMEATSLPSGTVYPALSALERRGYLTAAWEPEAVATEEGRPRRRYYALTGAGQEAMRDALRRLGAEVEASEHTARARGR